MRRVPPLHCSRFTMGEAELRGVNGSMAPDPRQPDPRAVFNHHSSTSVLVLCRTGRTQGTV